MWGCEMAQNYIQQWALMLAMLNFLILLPDNWIFFNSFRQHNTNTKLKLKRSMSEELGSSVSVVLGFLLDDWVLIPGRGKRFVSWLACPDPLWGPSSLLFSEYWRQMGFEADHWPVSSVRVKNEWSYTSVSSLYIFMAWWLINSRDSSFVF